MQRQGRQPTLIIKEEEEEPKLSQSETEYGDSSPYSQTNFGKLPTLTSR